MKKKVIIVVVIIVLMILLVPIPFKLREEDMLDMAPFLKNNSRLN
mgnify:CR=1 FL=1